MSFNFFKKDTLPKEIRRALAPEPGRLAHRRQAFLAAYDQKFGAVAEPSFRFAFAMRMAGGAFVVLLGIVGSASVYANAENVPAESPLYSLKRLNESMRLVLASEEDRPHLELELIERRVKEIDALKEKEERERDEASGESEGGDTPEEEREEDHEKQKKKDVKEKRRENLIHVLQKDVHKKLDNSVEKAEKLAPENQKLGAFCEQFTSSMVTSSFAIREEFTRNPKLFERAQKKCVDRADQRDDSEEKMDKNTRDERGVGDEGLEVENDKEVKGVSDMRGDVEDEHTGNGKNGR